MNDDECVLYIAWVFPRGIVWRLRFMAWAYCANRFVLRTMLDDLL
jgi:hypothetical protein